MPAFRIYIDCATPTGKPGGTLDTFVVASEEEYQRGVHIERAVRHALIRGFGGPHRIVQVRAYGLSQDAEQAPPRLLPTGASSSAHDRLRQLLTAPHQEGSSAERPDRDRSGGPADAGEPADALHPRSTTVEPRARLGRTSRPGMVA